MVSFRFRLERVLTWYRRSARIEEDRLRVILADYNQIDVDKKNVRDAREAAERTLAQSQVITAGDLAAISGFAEGSRRDLLALDQKRAELEGIRTEQQQKLNLLRTKIRLMEKLRERRLAEHQAEEVKELDELAADAYRSAMFRLGTESAQDTQSAEAGPPQP